MLYGYLVGFGYMIVLLAVSELLTRFTRIPKEIIRKILHLLIGFEYLVLYHFFGASWQIVVIPATFVVLNTLSYRLRFLKSIVRDQGEHAGIIYYAVSITALSVVCACIPEFLYPFGVGVFCLSFGDCAAALAGKYLRPRIRLLGNKTLWGFVFCFVFSFLSQLLLAWITQHPLALGNMLLIALICAGCE
ncbi:MAG: hypothetical protein J5755_00400, partial [Clostridia bacterium]|nr:hypothetical protein [Clostridia bacterium]